MRKIGGLSGGSAEARSLQELSRSAEKSEGWLPIETRHQGRTHSRKQRFAPWRRAAEKTAVRDVVSADGAAGSPRDDPV